MHLQLKYQQIRLANVSLILRLSCAQRIHQLKPPLSLTNKKKISTGQFLCQPNHHGWHTDIHGMLFSRARLGVIGACLFHISSKRDWNFWSIVFTSDPDDSRLGHATAAKSFCIASVFKFFMGLKLIVLWSCVLLTLPPCCIMQETAQWSTIWSSDILHWIISVPIE